MSSCFSNLLKAVTDDESLLTPKLNLSTFDSPPFV